MKIDHCHCYIRYYISNRDPYLVSDGNCSNFRSKRNLLIYVFCMARTPAALDNMGLININAVVSNLWLYSCWETTNPSKPWQLYFHNIGCNIL